MSISLDAVIWPTVPKEALLVGQSSRLPMGPEFCVLDTEGAPSLRETAVVDARGQRIFEARIPSEEDSYHAQDLVRPLPDLLRDRDAQFILMREPSAAPIRSAAASQAVQLSLIHI